MAEEALEQCKQHVTPCHHTGYKINACWSQLGINLLLTTAPAINLSNKVLPRQQTPTLPTLT